MTERASNRVGVRELRQNLSVYLDRVKDGETLEVTEHGQPVARLTPLTAAHASSLDRLLADGLAISAPGSLASLPPPLADSPRSLSTALEAQREEERA
jgi:prevent-host-death family protein